MKTIGNVLSTETLNKKEAIKMIRKYLALMLAASIVIFNVLPAQAYTTLQTPVVVTATGTLTGATVAFTTTVVAQSTGTPGTQVDFASPSGLSDSEDALKITGGTNEIGARIIIYTDNATYFTTGHDPRLKQDGVTPSGIDGAGLVGQTEAGYVAGMFWGIKSGTNNDPNTNMNYVFVDPKTPIDGNAGNSVFVVDKGHTLSFIAGAVGSGLDNVALYKLDGTAVTNTSNDGMYPQYWDIDLYNSATVHTAATKVSPALYSSIATIAYSISALADTTTPANSSYVCNVSNLTTYDGVANSTKSGDYVTAKLAKYGAGTTDNFLYVYIGANFTGLPAQVYTTAKLYVAMVKD